MGVIEATALGIVQGLTEFFPVSSSGHLVLAESLLGVDTPGVSFEVFVHLATVAAVVVVYRRRIARVILRAGRRDPEAVGYLGKLVLGSVPAGVAGLTLAGPVARAFDSPTLVAGNLIVTGAIVYSTRWLVFRGQRPLPTWGGSLVIGVAQALALLPGISRSGATVAAALGDRTERTSAAEFSFLLSIPAILGASLLELPALMSGGFGLGAAAAAAAFVSAFLAAILAIVLFVRWLRIGRFHLFAYYCWIVGAGFLVYAGLAP